MSESEHQLLDATGRFTQVVRDGTDLDVGWAEGRILVSNRRVLFVCDDGKLTLPLSDVEDVSSADVDPTEASVADVDPTEASVADAAPATAAGTDVARATEGGTRCVRIRFDGDVYLFTTTDVVSLERTLYEAILDGEVLLVEHPAVGAGVDQDVAWRTAKISLGADGVSLATEDGASIRIGRDDVEAVDRTEHSVRSARRPVLEVRHTHDGTSVTTYLSGPPRSRSVLGSALTRWAPGTESSIELDPPEREILAALYSGVPPLDVPAFLDMDPDEVEDIYDRLLELDVLQEVRTRREVALNARGRNVASDSINGR